MNHALRTPRLHLTPVEAADLDRLTALFSDPFVRKYLLDDQVLPREQVEGFVSTSLDLFAERGYGLWLLREQPADEPIGFAGLWHFFDETQPQLLYGLLPTHTGRGLATEAARAVVEYAFSSLGFSYLDASSDVPNVASHRVAERLGMSRLKEERSDGRPTLFFRVER